MAALFPSQDATGEGIAGRGVRGVLQPSSGGRQTLAAATSQLAGKSLHLFAEAPVRRRDSVVAGSAQDSSSFIMRGLVIGGILLNG